jgi:acetoin utilization protein AcuB
MIVDLSVLRVRDWTAASPPVITPRTTIATALRLLREHSIPALPVWDQGRFVGMAHETDLLRLTPSEATTLDVYELREVLDRMTVTRVIASASAWVAPDDSLAEAGKLLLRVPHGIIPVVDDGRPVGLLTWADVLRAAAGSAATAMMPAARPASLRPRGRGPLAVAVEGAR